MFSCGETVQIYGITVQFLLPTSFSQQISHSAAGCGLHCVVCTQLESTSPVPQPSLQPDLAVKKKKRKRKTCLSTCQ